jgi:protoporphyrin/coproporphyrin ferrochelatase
VSAPSSYDAILVLSFGGPEKQEDVIPFLENVLRGRNVPPERMLAVAEHYYQFGGTSPINSQNRALIAALETELAMHGPQLPVYWGNRNWHPLLADTLGRMKADGVRRALAFVASAYSSYSACRQYLDDIVRARAAVGSDAPDVDKLRAFYDHPGFIGPMIERVQAAFDQVPDAALLFTAHSIPLAMAQTSRYEAQLREACRLVAAGVGHADWQLVYQSRSGPPSQPWLDPDIGDALRGLRAVKDVVVAPIGFISDHMEVVYDLDTEARGICRELGLNMVRAGTVGTHPAFVSMIRELVLERLGQLPPRALGALGVGPNVCAIDCCPAPKRG